MAEETSYKISWRHAGGLRDVSAFATQDAFKNVLDTKYFDMYCIPYDYANNWTARYLSSLSNTDGYSIGYKLLEKENRMNVYHVIVIDKKQDAILWNNIVLERTDELAKMTALADVVNGGDLPVGGVGDLHFAIQKIGTGYEE
jgi:hypothetical protein